MTYKEAYKNFKKPGTAKENFEARMLAMQALEKMARFQEIRKQEDFCPMCGQILRREQNDMDIK